MQVDVRPISIVPFFFILNDVYSCRTELQNAVLKGDENCLQQLLQNRASVDATDRSSPNLWSVPSCHVLTMAAMSARGPGCCLSGVCQGRTALHLAANEVSGPSNIMRMLLEARASLMAKDVTGLDPQSSLPTGHSDT